MKTSLSQRPYVALTLMGALVLAIFVGSFLAGKESVEPSNPADYFIVDSVEVQDTLYGEDPTMDVDRTVLKPFFGSWVARVADEQGTWVCGNSGEAPYRPDARLPEDLRLFDYWLLGGDNPAEFCRPGYYPLPAGQCYTVDTTWQWIDRATGNVLSTHRRTQRPFCVTEGDK